jgi:hypothetical protein
MGARVYNPTTGRFLQVDPVEAGTPNNYTYPTDPINQMDLNGRDIWPDCLLGHRKGRSQCRGTAGAATGFTTYFVGAAACDKYVPQTPGAQFNPCKDLWKGAGVGVTLVTTEGFAALGRGVWRVGEWTGSRIADTISWTQEQIDAAIEAALEAAEIQARCLARPMHCAGGLQV